MKICQLTASLSWQGGGLFQCIRRSAQSLHDLGEEIFILGIEDLCTQRDLPLWSPLNPVIAQRKFPWKAGYAPDLRKLLGDVDIDLVHMHGLWMYHSLVTLGWAQQTKKPHIVSPHGMLEPWAWHHNAWKKRPVWWAWEKRNVESAAVLQATAYEEADNLRALGLRNPIAIIPNGVDIPELRQRPQREIRTALFISRIHPKKGLLNLVKAWALLRPKDWRMVIAGPSEGGHEAEVKNAVMQAGLENQFDFPGPVYEGAKWDLYNQADLFVLPTYSENFGIVIAEALAAGVPVITTKNAPWRQLVEHDCGWWVDIGVDPLAEALREAMLCSAAERQEMGLRGRKLVQDKYSWPTIADEMAAVYRWVLGQGPKPVSVWAG